MILHRDGGGHAQLENAALKLVGTQFLAQGLFSREDDRHRDLTQALWLALFTTLLSS